MHQTFYLSFFLCMPAKGAVSLKMASKKPLCVYVFGLPDWDCPLGSARLTGLGRFRRQIEGPYSQADLGP